MVEEQKKERKSLGVVFQNVNKDNPKSYDLKGTITVEGKKYRVGAYAAKSSGKGKLPEGAEYFWFHRVEELELNQAGESFDPASLDS